ncbi:hypothetical protein VULLAG_LOCUS10323 [Vulpes lagopus]
MLQAGPERRCQEEAEPKARQECASCRCLNSLKRGWAWAPDTQLTFMKYVFDGLGLPVSLKGEARTASFSLRTHFPPESPGRGGQSRYTVGLKEQSSTDLSKSQMFPHHIGEVASWGRPNPNLSQLVWLQGPSANINSDRDLASRC